MKKAFASLTILFLIANCTFGSVGNSNKEKLQSLVSLLSGIRDARVNLSTELYFYDDQLDSNINSFRLNAGTPSQNFQVTILPVTTFVFSNITYRVNPPSTVLGSPLIPNRTHTPYTVPVQTSSGDPYGAAYAIPNIQTISNLGNSNTSLPTGPAILQTSPILPNVPQGLISNTTISWSSIDLQAQVVRSSDGLLRTVRIRVLNPSVSFFPRCAIPLATNGPNKVKIGIRFSNLFRDRISGGVQTSILSLIAANPNASVIATDLTDVAITTEFAANLVIPDLVIVQESCQ